ncbi:MAG: DUF1573 domain-containing protein [Verrucomicrobia bacterium]|nr:DUF1573 domain-containing protein [Verrucomicrobiota bacterium]
MRFSACLVLVGSLMHSAYAGLVWETTYREIRVPANEKELFADFGFKNTGTAPLDIASLETSCGCTVAKIDKKQIAPGEAGAVHVRFDIGSRKGEQVKGIVVKTSDRTRQTLVLRVLIQDPVAFSQREFVWSSGGPATPKESIVELGAGARILGVESLNDQFDARLEEMDAGIRYRLVVTPRSTGIPVDTSIKIQIADPKKRSVLLQARIEN